MNARNFLCGMLLITLMTTTTAARKWTAATGNFSVEAEFVRVEGGKAILRAKNGSRISIPLEKLSTADQQFVRSKTSDGANWRKDWSDFGIALTKSIQSALPDTKPEPDGGRKVWFKVSKAFNGKAVEWTGTVLRFIPSSDKEQPASIVMAMTPLSVTASDRGEVVADCVVLKPNSDQWRAWSGIKEGSTVSFHTTLSNAGVYPCVFAWTGRKSRPRPYWIHVSTKGAMVLREIGAGDGTAANAKNRSHLYYSRKILSVERNQVSILTSVTQDEKREILEAYTQFVLVDDKRKIVARPFLP